MLTHSWMQHPCFSWYQLPPESSPEGQKTTEQKDHWKKEEGDVESGQEEVFKRNGAVHSQMSQRFISFSMGIYYSDQTQLSGFFFLKSSWDIYHLLWGLLQWQNFFSTQVLGSGFRLKILREAIPR